MKIVTPVKHYVRLSYVSIATPRQDNGKYSVCIMIPKSDEALKKAFDKVIADTAENDKAKWNGKIPKDLKLPIHDGDDKADEHPEFADMWYFNASSTQRPGVLDIDGSELFDYSEIYSGCWARVSVNFSGYNQNGNRGIGAYINNIKKAKDDDKLGGTSASAAEDFGDEAEEDELM